MTDLFGKIIRTWVGIAAVACLNLTPGLNPAAEATWTADQIRVFEEQVHPILANRCYSCHGPDTQESGFRMDAREAILSGGDSGEPGAKAGDAAASRIINAVRHAGDLQMPPDEKIPDQEIEVLVAWVNAGLPWSAKSETASPLTPEQVAEAARQEHWAFQPIVRPAFPTIKDSSLAASGIDYFVLSKLDAAGLQPSTLADRRTLIRRLSFDLLGIPPSPEAVDEFIQDASPDAYVRLVDRMLASPRYGERWARHWLDVARCADTRGYAFQGERRYPYAYTYRDYVIRALNADKPFNTFVVEQIAADLLPAQEDKSYLAAMGFLTTGRKFNNRQDDLDDQIDVVSRGLLGLTVACARCHDHKYDAIPTEDYYSLYGVFASSQEPDELPVIGAEAKLVAGYEEYQKELAKKRAELDEFRANKHKEFLETSRKRVGDYLVRVIESRTETLISKLPFSGNRDDLSRRLVERWQGYLKANGKPDHPVFGPWSELAALPNSKFAEQSPAILDRWKSVPEGSQPGELHPAVKAALLGQTMSSQADVARAYGQALAQAYDEFAAAGCNDDAFGKLSQHSRMLAEIVAGPNSPTAISLEELPNYLNRADRNQFRDLQKKIESFEASSPAAPPRAMVLADSSSPENPRVFIRGNPARPGKAVPRQPPLLLAGSSRQPFSKGSGRLELAEQIVHAENPLTRRVIANRIWMHHFGESLVRTPSDFGIRCERPVHAELLDYLAARLLEENWSLKELHREIVLSRTYQQTSSVRSDEMPAGGEDPRAIDPENRLYWRMNRQRLEFEPLRDSLLVFAGELDLSMGGRSVSLTSDRPANRRAVYGFIDRQDLPNLFRVFDFASPDQSQAQRPRTTVPQQALYLMNSPFALDLARSLAARPQIREAVDGKQKIQALYRIVFQRTASDDEVAVAEGFIRDAEAAAREGDKLSPWERLAQLLLMTNEVAFVD